MDKNTKITITIIIVILVLYTFRDKLPSFQQWFSGVIVDEINKNKP